MAITKTHYADGTYFERSYPWGINVSCRALCPDGVVRKCSRIAITADTFFSIPASVKYRGRTVAGYVTVETRDGFTTEMPDDPAVVKFCPYLYRKNGALFDSFPVA